MITAVDASTTLGFGTGIYSVPQARVILGRSAASIGLAGPRLSSRKLHHWLKTGLVPVTLDRLAETVLLTFDDLISLEMVRRLRAVGLSLQRIRRAEADLRRLLPGVSRPFARRLFFTDGRDIWAEIEDTTQELVGSRQGHLVIRDAIGTFAKEIRYDAEDRAVAWDVSDHVEINPRVRFGDPVVRGTRITVETVMRNLDVGSPTQVADWYGLTEEQVQGVARYATLS